MPGSPLGRQPLSLLGDQQAAFRFAPAAGRGEWTIDDVYVDPYKKGLTAAHCTQSCSSSGPQSGWYW